MAKTHPTEKIFCFLTMEKILYPLVHFMPLVSFYIPSKHQKIKGLICWMNSKLLMLTLEQHHVKHRRWRFFMKIIILIKKLHHRCLARHFWLLSAIMQHNYTSNIPLVSLLSNYEHNLNLSKSPSSFEKANSERKHLE